MVWDELPYKIKMLDNRLENFEDYKESNAKHDQLNNFGLKVFKLSKR